MNIPWWQTAVIYQIYPRSFQDSNNDGIGDLPGIRQRLNYLVKLGVDAIWLSPFYPSPMADFGYDVADYCDVDPCFGTLNDFDDLLNDCHQLGLRVIIDLVPNHTSDQHPWFLESRSSRDNPKRSWYIWQDPAAGGGLPNNWLSRFGGPAWTLDSTTGQYYMHQFATEQPELNWREPAVAEAIHEAMRFWLRRGVDGFRVDVIWLLVKDKKLRDEPLNPDFLAGVDKDHRRLQHIHTEGLPEVHELIRDMRKVINEFSDRVMIGEIYLPIPELITYYGNNDECHQPFNFHLIRKPFTATAIRELIREYEACLQTDQWPSWVLGNHDQPRIAGRTGPERVALAQMLLLTLRGTPTCYQGDELGLLDVHVPPERLCDPQALRQTVAGNIHGRDPVRSPMIWDDSCNAGFTSEGIDPWLPLDSRWQTINAEQQDINPASLLNFLRRLLNLRRQEPALHRGTIELLDCCDNQILGYLRTTDVNNRFLILLNFSSETKSALLPSDIKKATMVLSTDPLRQPAESADCIQLQPGEGLICRILEE